MTRERGISSANACSSHSGWMSCAPMPRSRSTSAACRSMKGLAQLAREGAGACACRGSACSDGCSALQRRRRFELEDDADGAGRPHRQARLHGLVDLAGTGGRR
ncbi:MAG: hypothetical protein U1F67_09785 [Rubrivivax sp.]